MLSLKRIKSFAVIVGAPLRQNQNPCQPPRKQIEATKKRQRGNCFAPIVRLPMNSGALVYNAALLSDGKPLLREKKSLRSTEELHLKEKFPPWPPPGNKRLRRPARNSSVPLAKLSTNAGLLV
jgi:hypothetical protein